MAVFTSRSGFASDFNHFAAPITGTPDPYHQTITAAKHAGIDTSPTFSLSNSLPLIAVFSSFGIFAYLTAYIGSELREGSSIKTAHRMAAGAMLGLGAVALFIAIFFASWGRDFLTAGYALGLPKGLEVTPTYFVLTSMQLHSTAMTIFQTLAFVAFCPVLTVYLLVTISRILFAWAFDDLLPSGVTSVSRTNAPVVATVIATALSVLCYAWAIYVADNFIQVVAYAVLIQLIPMALVGVAAVILPRVRPALFRASATTRSVAGIPVVVIAGVGSIVSTVVLYVLYFKYDYFGISNHHGEFFAWLFGTIGAGALWYLGAKMIRRRQGVDLDLVYREIPPE